MTAAASVWETPERQALRASVTALTRKEIVPNLPQWEEDGMLPRELHLATAKAGFLGLGFPEAVGGTGGDLVDVTVAAEAMLQAGGSGGVATVGRQVRCGCTARCVGGRLHAHHAEALREAPRRRILEPARARGANFGGLAPLIGMSYFETFTVLLVTADEARGAYLSDQLAADGVQSGQTHVDDQRLLRLNQTAPVKPDRMILGMAGDKRHRLRILAMSKRDTGISGTAVGSRDPGHDH